MNKKNMVEALNLALKQEMEDDDEVIIMGEDVGIDGGVFRVTDGLIDIFGEERVKDSPLAESGIVGTATGMALGGLKPVCEIQFSGFSYLAMEQLEAYTSRYRSRTRSQRNVPLVVRMPYGGGVRALEHHSESREALFAQIPGLKVVIPSTPRNARGLLTSAIRDPDPVIFMEPKALYRAFREEIPEEEDTFPIGKAWVRKEGEDITAISWGAMIRPLLKAQEDIEKQLDADVEVIDLMTVSPMDIETVTESVKKTGRCVIVQEAPRTLGAASEIIAHINDEALMYLEAPVKRITGYDLVTPYFGREEHFLPDKDTIYEALKETLTFK